MKRFKYYEAFVWLYLLFNVVFQVINEDFLDCLIPQKYICYSYWFNIGLFVGLQIHKYLVRKHWKEQNKEHL